MSLFRPVHIVAAVAVLVIGQSIGLSAAMATTVTVTLRSGRTLTGELDSRSTNEQLVLRFEGPSSRLWRPIVWDQIAAATHDGQSISIDELRQLAERDATAAAPIVLPPPEPRDDTRTWNQPRSMVASLHIEAAMANWDADVDPDGVIVEAWALDQNGTSVAVDGTLEVELIAARPAALYGRFVRTRGEPFPQLAYGSFALRGQDAANGSGRFKLHFQHRNPQFDLSVAELGLVHARLSVPGQGVFEASADLVRIRSHSPTRDDHQQFTDRWYFHREWTSPHP